MAVPGKLVFERGLRSLDCAIGDMSVRGARVRVSPGATSIPREIWLVHLKEWHAYQARVVWRRADGNLGLAFGRSFELKGALNAELKTLREHCAAYDERM